MNRAGGERGATAVAYAVMVAILALLLVGGLMLLSGSIEEAFGDASNCVANPTDCEIGGGGTGGGGDNGNGNGGGTTTATTSPGTTTTTTGP